MAYIEVIQPEQAQGLLQEIYEDLINKRGKLAEVHKIQSLNPPSIVHHMDLYMGIMFGKSPLKRPYREMIAVVVSAANNCAYCITHHAEALQHFWKDQDKVDQLAKDYRGVELTSAEQALCAYAHQLTTGPTHSQVSVETLKACGWEDRAILDAALVISYFNFVNRMVLGLGVHLEAEGAGGYRYE